MTVATDGNPVGNLKSILVVDDDETTRGVIIDALRESGYFNTREVENGLQALSLLNTSSFDLIISDLKMPGMSGLELLARIKHFDFSTPVIIITGYPTIDLTVSAMKEGAVDFLTKPFKIDDLIFKVNLYLQERSLLSEEDRDERETKWKLDEKIRELSTIRLIGERIDQRRGLAGDDMFDEIVKLSLALTRGKTGLIVLVDETNKRFINKSICHSSHHNGADTGDVLAARLTPFFRETVSSRLPLLINGDHGLRSDDSLITVPLTIRGSKIFGILAVFSGDGTTIFTRKDLTLVQNLAERASLYLENTILYESLFGSIMNTFESLIHSIHARDNYTERHSRSVTHLSVLTAEALGCSDYEIESLRISAHLHDIGKIAVPDHILLKPAPLSDDEYRIIQTHAEAGEDILKSIALFDRERTIVRHHHERWDGRGYPDGLARNEIPLLARILSVADTFDAMTSDRPYRKALPPAVAVEELRNNRWKQLDGTAVDAFLSALETARQPSKH